MINEIEKRIEELRLKMYQGFESKLTYEELLIISQDLDQWLNNWNELKVKEKAIHV